ncbi:MAG: patatin-like phospholipase family protein [Deltaproteobacteria bacterium]|nr:patatin-like phospholipase family protein [Deltaproteobacteria bacterium]
MTRKKSLSGKRRIAFVASGGAVKAACFHVGVCLAMEEKGFTFLGGPSSQQPVTRPDHPVDIYVGSSAGSVITSLLAQGYSAHEIVRSFVEKSGAYSHLNIHYRDLFRLPRTHIGSILKKYFLPRRKLFKMGIESFLKNYLLMSGFFSTKGLEVFLRQRAFKTNQFHELPVDQFVIATHLDSSQKTVFGSRVIAGFSQEHQCDYYDKAPISEAVAASVAMPPFYQPYPINKNGKVLYYFDGEIKKTLSTHVAKDAGADLIIASYTHQPYHYVQSVGSLVNHGLPSILIQAIYQSVEQKIRTAKKIHDDKILIIQAIREFFKKNSLSKEFAELLCHELAEKLDLKPDLDYILIHPHANDHKFFFSDHFNLSPKVMEQTVNCGFKSALRVLKDYSL